MPLCLCVCVSVCTLKALQTSTHTHMHLRTHRLKHVRTYTGTCNSSRRLALGSKREACTLRPRFCHTDPRHRQVRSASTKAPLMAGFLRRCQNPANFVQETGWLSYAYACIFVFVACAVRAIGPGRLCQISLFRGITFRDCCFGFGRHVG